MSKLHESPLRHEVSRWFGADSGARVSHFGRVYPGACRYVCVRAPLMAGFFSLNFLVTEGYCTKKKIIELPIRLYHVYLMTLRVQPRPLPLSILVRSP